MQDDVVSRKQALGCGLSPNVIDRLLHSGAWRRLSSGLYLTVPVAPSWEALAWGGVLIGGPRSRLGPEASGYLWKLDQHPPEVVDVLVPLERTLRSRDHWQFVRERPTARSDRSRGNPSRLIPEDTVLDLADRRTERQVVSLVTGAVNSHLTTAGRLRQQLALRVRHRHRDLLIGMLAEVDEGAESPLELKFLRDVERPHGLPRGNRQSSANGLPYCRDVLYEEFALLVELDGRDGHAGIGRFRDMNRDNLHALRDELTLRFGWFDVTARPCPVAYQVFLVLCRRGYVQPFRRCRGCTGVPEVDLATS